VIEFLNVSKQYRLNGAVKTIVRNLTYTLPAHRKIALIGRNGAGKSTLLRMICGTLRPDSGKIRRKGRISWPMGFSGGLHPALTGRQNARFVARIYGADTDEMVTFVEEFAELGPFLDMPLQTYSSGMRARLAFGVSMAAKFDCYLVDEITAVGDAGFRKKCQRVFADRLGQAQLVMVSHAEGTLREYCDSALVLEQGILRYFDDIEEGIDAYHTLVPT
jgi:capsular polysaccharide transport system ATP-binding protein